MLASHTHTAIIPRLFLGLALIAFFWPASWLQWGLLGTYSFFPLWLGYILTTDGLVGLRRGRSLLTTSPRHFLALFVVSAPIWWLFEGLNHFVLNWRYLIPADWSSLHLILVATINFAIVLPAVSETTGLVLTFSFIQRLAKTRFTFRVSRNTYWVLMYLGAGMFFVIWFWPQIAFGLVWVWLFLLVDALNALRGRPSLLEQCSRGDWRLTAALALGTLLCGFFWELWNYYAFPKWYYTVPIVGFWKVFEMPLLGYVGYIPFAWELYALYQYLFGLLKQKLLAFDV